MANLSKTRVLFAWTSPRTIEKIIPEIDLLIKNFEGKIWSGNASLQADFFHQLANSSFFEGQKQVKHPDFAARDRITRAPQMLGFVDLKPTIILTESGKKLLSGKRINEVITRQLLKFQLPSPYHNNFPKDTSFNIHPYLELLRLVKELGSVSKTEIAIFFLQLTNYTKFESTVYAIKKFREDAKNNKGNRKAFVEDRFKTEILNIYASEIKSNNLKTRESNDPSLSKFIKTKIRNHTDYADAFIRYLRATQLISFEKKTFRMIVSPSRTNEVDYILGHVERNALEFNSDEDYKKYLFNPQSLLLLNDNKIFLEKQLKQLEIKFDANASLDSLKDLLDATEKKIISQVIQETEIALKNYKEYGDIVHVFEKITKKDVPDPSLYLEWNIWRSFVMINFAKEVKGNFSIDLDGVPLNTALGNMPDIEVDYGSFKVIIEVTMSSGNKQYEMEGEPVARHFGKIQKSSDVPVYCLFVAPKISDGALAHFFNLNRMNTKTYGGKTRIVPMNLNQFLKFISIAKEKSFNDSKILKTYFELIIHNNLLMDDEEVWFQQINSSIPLWVQ